MGRRQQQRDLHPWRTARRESWTVQEFWGKVLDLVCGLLALLVARALGWSEAGQLILAFVVGVVIVPFAEMVVRRVRGPVRGLLQENAKLVRKIDKLQEKIRLLEHPSPLDIHLDRRHPTAILRYVNLEDCSFSGAVGGVSIWLFGGGLTNRTAKTMQLDCLMMLRLVTAAKLNSETVEIVKPTEVVSEGGKIVRFVVDPMRVDPEDAPSFDATFLIFPAWLHVWGGVENIAEDGHTFTLSDRVSGRSHTEPFRLNKNTYKKPTA
jgi:hypothetical protein